MAQRKEANGKWCFYGKYKQPDGTWKTFKRRGYRTKKEAKEAEAAFDPYAAAKIERMRFADLVEDYEKVQKNFLKPNALEINVRYLKKYGMPVFEKKFIDKITRKDVTNWRTWLLEEHGDLKASTLNKIKSSMQAAFTYAVKMEYIDRSPADRLPDFRARSESDLSDKDNFMELEDFNNFIVQVPDPADRILYTFLFWTGCRISEALGLRWKDFDLDRGTFTIQWQLTRKGDMITTKTTNSVRTVDLFSGLLEMMEEKYDQDKDMPGFNPDYYVFGDIEPLKYPAMALRFRRLKDRIDCKPITLHGFRHSHASYLIEQGIDDTLIAQRLGMTVNVLRKTYAHVYHTQRNKMKKLLENNFSNFFSPNLVQLKNEKGYSKTLKA